MDACGNTAQCCFSVIVRGHGVREWKWAELATSGRTDSGNAIAVDKKGNVFVTGSYGFTFTFPSSGVTLQSFALGGNDIFVAKYNTAGVLQWAVRAGGSDSDVGYGVAVDEDGNAYVTGEFTGSATFESVSGPVVGPLLAPSGSRDIFVAKYDSSGHCNGVNQWVRNFGGADADIGYGIAIAPSGDVLVTGAWEVSGTREAFVLRLDSANGLQLGLAFSAGPAGHTGTGRAIVLPHTSVAL
jgi:hypothetical protein